MIITCPACKTKFRISEDKISSDRSKLRCSRCGHVFFAKKEATKPENAAQNQAEDKSLQMTQSLDVEEQPEQISQREMIVDEQEQDSPTGNAVEEKRISSLWIWLLAFIVLIAIIFTAYNFLPQIKEAIPFLASRTETSSRGELPQKEVTPSKNMQEQLKDITLRDVRQYMVTNDKIGQITVIEGKVLNKSAPAKRMIKMQAKLYDQQGNTIASKKFFCGNTASLFQLQVLDRKELDSKLQSKVGIITNNSNVSAGQEVKFMTVFFNTPADLSEFSLKVIQAQLVEKDQ